MHRPSKPKYEPDKIKYWIFIVPLIVMNIIIPFKVHPIDEYFSVALWFNFSLLMIFIFSYIKVSIDNYTKFKIHRTLMSEYYIGLVKSYNTAQETMNETLKSCIESGYFTNVQNNAIYELYFKNNFSYQSFSKDDSKLKFGLADKYFFEILKKTIDGAQIGQAVSFTHAGKYYQFIPDILVIKNNAFICIEIDEPYIFNTGEPIHYIDSNDSIRDFIFTINGFFVIRFTEWQALVETNNCINLVKEVYDKINTGKYFGPTELITTNAITIQPRWSKQEAEFKFTKKERNSYIKNISFDYSNIFFEIKEEISENTSIPIKEEDLLNLDDVLPF